MSKICGPERGSRGGGSDFWSDEDLCGEEPNFCNETSGYCVCATAIENGQDHDGFDVSWGYNPICTMNSNIVNIIYLVSAIVAALLGFLAVWERRKADPTAKRILLVAAISQLLIPFFLLARFFEGPLGVASVFILAPIIVLLTHMAWLVVDSIVRPLSLLFSKVNFNAKAMEKAIGIEMTFAVLVFLCFAVWTLILRARMTSGGHEPDDVKRFNQAAYGFVLAAVVFHSDLHILVVNSYSKSLTKGVNSLMDRTQNENKTSSKNNGNLNGGSEPDSSVPQSPERGSEEQEQGHEQGQGQRQESGRGDPNSDQATHPNSDQATHPRSEKLERFNRRLYRLRIAVLLDMTLVSILVIPTVLIVLITGTVTFAFVIPLAVNLALMFPALCAIVFVTDVGKWLCFCFPTFLVDPDGWRHGMRKIGRKRRYPNHMISTMSSSNKQSDT